MRLFKDLLVLLGVSLAIAMLIHIAFAIMVFVSRATDEAASRLTDATNGTVDTSLMYFDISPLVQSLEIGLIICFVSMVVAVFMYSRKR